MHAVEDIFVHNMDFEVVILTDLIEILGELFKGDGSRAYLGEHDHSEHILQYALSHFDDVYAYIRAGCAYLAEYTYAVLAEYSDYSFLLLTSVKSY